MRKFFVRLLGAILLGGFAASAQAQLTIEITAGVDQAMPIAVVPLGWQGGLTRPPLDVAAVIAADLSNSGRFDAMDPHDMLEQPVDEQGIDFEDWRLLGLEAIVVGRLLPQSDGTYVIQFELFDLFKQRRLLGFRLPSTGAGLRAAAHRVSDLIYEKLTGIKGAFATRIAFITVQGQGSARRYRLVVADADGANEITIMESTDPIMSPAWSPDSRRLAYVSFENNISTIYVQTLRTGNRIKVSSRAGINGAPAFSPDGRKLVLTLGGIDGNLDINILDLASRNVTRLTTNRSIDTEGTWAPDGRAIYFTSDRSGGPQVYRVSLNGGSPERITFEGSYNARPRLSPDGSKLAMVHLDRGNYRIAVLDLDSRDLLVLSGGSQDESPSFAPNSDSLIYATRQGGNGVLETVSADGLVRQRLASRQGDVREPVWSPYPRF